MTHVAGRRTLEEGRDRNPDLQHVERLQRLAEGVLGAAEAVEPAYTWSGSDDSGSGAGALFFNEGLSDVDDIWSGYRCER